MPRKEIDQKYIDRANQLEVEFFDIIDEGLPSQHRVSKTGKSEAEFNQRHGDIWKAHETELIATGYLQPTPVPEPVRDLLKELDAVKADIEAIKREIRI